LIDEPGTFVLAWTTTPWTLPGNTALAVHKDIVYVKVKSISQGKVSYYILAKSKVTEYFKDSESYEIVEEFIGGVLVGKTYKPVFLYFKEAALENKANLWKVWHADFITEDAGTGIAHEAPAFGAEDMELARASNIPVIKHVKMDGTFIAAVTDFAGMKVKVKGDTQLADIEIIKYLAHNGLLFEKHKIIHSYPLCWRCKTPLLNYATSSWFVDVPKIKEKLISENKTIGWVPEHTRDGRFGKWLEGAREWAVSRSRYWGAPLPVWKSDDGDVKVLGSLKELAELTTSRPKNTYYAVRHGESESNIRRTIDSKGDPRNHLTERGKEQAHHAEHFTRELDIDLIIHSPLVRTEETAQIIRGGTKAEIRADERLRELNVGTFDGRSVDEFHVYQHESLKTMDDKALEGESHHEVMERLMSLLFECEEKYQGKKILFVTHGTLVWMLEAIATLRTDEELISDMMKHEDVSTANARVIPITPMLVPRDEQGHINLHRPYIDKVELSLGGKVYRRIPDVFDCWFESGSMPFASLHYPFENKDIFEKNYPADFIAEGVDQTRGWFYSLINLGVGLFGKAPYKHVIVNGLILAESGAKLSKSEKNYTDPMVLVEKYGADAMRYALLSSPVVKGENLLFGDDSVSDVYKKLISRLDNVIHLYEMNKKENIVASAASKDVLDRWMISRIHELVRDATVGYETYKLDEATRGIGDIIDDLSVWYTRRSRDRLKGDAGEDNKIMAYHTLTYTLQTLAKVLAPVMPFLAERVYKAAGGTKQSVHLESWPIAGHVDEEILRDMKDVREAVSLGLMKRTEHKINVKQPLASVTLKKPVKEIYVDLIKDELNLKEVIINASQADDVSLDITMTDELIHEGDIRKLMRAIQDMRKEKNLTPQDSIVLVTKYEIAEEFLATLTNTCRISSFEKGNGPYYVEVSTGEISFDIK
jgi:isoleucyl-tRNA synthetase